MVLERLGTGGAGRGTEKGFLNTGTGISVKILVCEAGGRALWILGKGARVWGADQGVCMVVVGKCVIVMVHWAPPSRSAV